ncbi:MAG: family 20 glycosylhydrolase [Candidatus Glassbacteria bacterium]|nr:family 20 glycosylhydrolase [Candidatus Glassbacteria bacterium]
MRTAQLKFLTVISCLVLTVSSAGAQAQTELWNEGISLIPYPQQAVPGGDDFVFGASVSIVLDNEASAADRFAAEDLAGQLKARFGITATIGGNAAGGSIVLTSAGVPSEGYGQGYALSVEPGKITVSGKGPGLFYGTRSLVQLVQNRREGWAVLGMKITDWPDIKYRVAHYDTKHHQDKAEYVRQFIRELADYKLNVLLWEWEDKFAYESHPEIGAPGAFTPDEMREFTRYAQQYHVQIVPLVQGLGHVSFILKWPQYKHLREIEASNWEFCPLKDGSYELLFDLWDEAIAATPGSEFMHLGTDETYELGRGVECGCRAKAEEIGRYGLMQIFLERCFEHISKQGRRVISWGGEYRPGEKIKPPKGLIVSEFTEDLDIAEASRDAGYPAWVYDPNPGIEHLFLPYFYRLRRGRQTVGALENSYRRLSVAASSGLYEGMVNTSWDDSGLHNQVWMMSWVNSAEYSWSGAAPSLDEFIDKYFVSYYGPGVRDMRELWQLFNDGAYYYMDTFERNVWHHGDIGKTHLPDLPRGDAVEYDPFWNREYADILARSRGQLSAMERASLICRTNIRNGVRHHYDFEIFLTIADLIAHTARTYVALSELENTITEAHRARFVSHTQVVGSLRRAAGIIEDNLDERKRVYDNLVAVWEKTRLPKGMSTPAKKFFHSQDRARHYAFRTADMSYLICDEQLLGLEDYLAGLKNYTEWYKKTYSQFLK